MSLKSMQCCSKVLIPLPLYITLISQKSLCHLGGSNQNNFSQYIQTSIVFKTNISTTFEKIFYEKSIHIFSFFLGKTFWRKISPIILITKRRLFMIKKDDEKLVLMLWTYGRSDELTLLFFSPSFFGITIWRRKISRHIGDFDKSRNLLKPEFQKHFRTYS